MTFFYLSNPLASPIFVSMDNSEYRPYEDDEIIEVSRTALITDRLVVRPFSMNDFDDLKSFVFDPELSRFSPNYFRDEKDLRFFLQNCEETYDFFAGIDDTSLSWAMEYDGKVVGEVTVSCIELDKIQKKIAEKSHINFLYNIGWTVRKEFWNKGFATEAAKAVADFVENYCIHNLGALYAECDEENVASRRVIEKLGMVKVRDRFIKTPLGKRKWNCYVRLS